MSTETGTATGGPPSLAVIVISGAFARVHYALVLAAAAAAVGTPTTLFFTMEGCRALGGGTAPGWRGLAGADADDAFAAQGIAGFEELLAACVDLGVRFLVCETGLRATGLAAADLRADVPFEIAGAVTLLTTIRPGGTLVMA